MASEPRRYGMGDIRLLKLSRDMEHAGCCNHANVDGISMNIQEESSAFYFRVQIEREQTFLNLAIYKQIILL